MDVHRKIMIVKKSDNKKECHLILFGVEELIAVL